MSLVSVRTPFHEVAGRDDTHGCLSSELSKLRSASTTLSDVPEPVNVRGLAAPLTLISSTMSHSRSPSTSSSQIPSCDRRSVFRCSWDGCGKTFGRATKLETHLNMHTGVRPYRCTHMGCEAAFRSSSKLAEHFRVHLSPSQQVQAKKFVCDVAQNGVSCGKRFRSGQHLARHKEGVHNLVSEGKCEGSAHQSHRYNCTELGCEESFTKRKQLRQHVWEQHTNQANLFTVDEDTPALPFHCTYPGCRKHFPTNSKRKAHYKTHETDRYLCVLPHPTADGENFSSGTFKFATWSGLQAHVREAHPPTCPHPFCNGKTFKRAENLRLHLRRHEQKEASDEKQLFELDSDADEHSAPRDSLDMNFVCNWQPSDGHEPAVRRCEKRFKSAHARDTHIRVFHLKERPFRCLCSKSYGHKHLLKRHQLKCSVSQSRQTDVFEDYRKKLESVGVSQLESDEEDEVFRSGGGALPDSLPDATTASTGSKRKRRAREEFRRIDSSSSMVDLLTGQGYVPTNAPNGTAEGGAELPKRGRILTCPWSHLSGQGAETLLSRRSPAPLGDEVGSATSFQETSAACHVRFSRVYDLRRHLRAAHAACLEDGQVRQLLGEDVLQQLPMPRKPSSH